MITGFGSSILCPGTWFEYILILLMLTTKYILTVFGSSNLTTFRDTTLLIL